MRRVGKLATVVALDWDVEQYVSQDANSYDDRRGCVMDRQPKKLKACTKWFRAKLNEIMKNF